MSKKGEQTSPVPQKTNSLASKPKAKPKAGPAGGRGASPALPGAVEKTASKKRQPQASSPKPTTMDDGSGTNGSTSSQETPSISSSSSAKQASKTVGHGGGASTVSRGMADAVAEDASFGRETTITVDEKKQSKAGMNSMLNGGPSSCTHGSIQVHDGDNAVPISHFCMILLAVMVPNAVILLGLSPVGRGLDFYNELAPTTWNTAGTGSACLAALLLCMYYIFDWNEWHDTVKIITALIPVLLFPLAGILKSRSYPWAPVIVALFLIPVICGLIRTQISPATKRKQFYMTFVFSSFVCSFALLLFWVVWILGDEANVWNNDNKAQMASKVTELYKAYTLIDPRVSNETARALNYTTDCGPAKDLARFNTEEKTDIGTDCKVAMTVLFTCWTAPLIGFMVNAFLGLFALLNGVLLKLDKSSDVSILEGRLKLFLGFLVLCMMGMYFSVSMSGASIQLGTALMAFFASALFVLLAVMYYELGHKNVQQHVKQSKLTQMLLAAGKSDWARAMFVGALNVALPTFLFLNILKQKVKKLVASAPADGDRFTPAVRKFVNELKTWNWTSLFTKICLLGELFFVMQVGVAKATYVFLSWLNNALPGGSEADFALVIVIIFFIGYTMFLLPPVPGVPVYVFCGIVVAEQGRKLDSIGFELGCVIAMVLAWCLKLAACTGQYMIGYGAGQYVSIQALIAVDKVPTRAIESILSERGITVGKVSVLVGGPDWPTSVTCGILKLNIPQMLIGTAPVFFVSSPCVLAGAFLGRVVVGEDSIYSALASTFTGLAIVGQMGCGFMAVKSITKVVEIDSELEVSQLALPRAEHQAVEELSRKQAVLKEKYDEVTKFTSLNFFRKATIFGAAACHLLSGFVFAMGGEYCFLPFAVSSDIGAAHEENGLNGDVFSIVLFPGRVALGVFGLGVVLHLIFSKDFSIMAANALKGGNAPLNSPVPDTLGSEQ